MREVGKEGGREGVREKERDNDRLRCNALCLPLQVMNVPLYMSSHASRQSQAMEARALHLQTLQAFQDRR